MTLKEERFIFYHLFLKSQTWVVEVFPPNFLYCSTFLSICNCNPTHQSLAGKIRKRKANIKNEKKTQKGLQLHFLFTRRNVTIEEMEKKSALEIHCFSFVILIYRGVCRKKEVFFMRGILASFFPLNKKTLKLNFKIVRNPEQNRFAQV